MSDSKSRMEAWAHWAANEGVPYGRGVLPADLEKQSAFFGGWSAACQHHAGLLEALKGILEHACIADAAPEDVDEEDRALERKARAAIAKAES